MSLHRSLLSALAVLPLAAACASAPPASPESPASPAATAAPAASAPAVEAIRAAVAGPQRSEKNRARDGARHPAEMLGFFGLRGDMTVLELWPGTGWFTEILAPVVAEHGKLLVTSLDPAGPQDKPGFRTAKELADRFKAEPQVFGKVQVQRIDPPEHFDFAPDGSVDLALVLRNTHDWVRDGYAEKVYAAIFKAVKPGGILGVEAHRGKPDADPRVVGKTGYLSEDYVIKLVEGAGFKLADKSEMNANPKDVKDYPEGVWSLPPTLRLGDKDREKYVAIGESDRMTLKFVKPAR